MTRENDMQRMKPRLSVSFNLVDFVSNGIGELFHLAFFKLQTLLLEEIHDVITCLFALFGARRRPTAAPATACLSLRE